MVPSENVEKPLSFDPSVPSVQFAKRKFREDKIERDLNFAAVGSAVN